MTFPFPSHYLPSRTVVLAIVFTVQATLIMLVMMMMNRELKYKQLINSECSVLFFSRHRSEGWPHHLHTPSPFISVLCHSD